MKGSRGTGFARVIVLGAGAIGSYYGSLISKEADVLLIGRKGHVEAVNERGLLVSGEVEGRFMVRASTELREIPEKSLVLLTTKAHDAEEAIRGVEGLLRPDTTILVLQNGLGNEELVRAIVGPSVMVVRGLASSGVEFREPGRIVVRFIGETVLPKIPPGERIKHLFDSCGLDTRLSERMDLEIWRKLTMNCVINPLTALFRVPNKEIATDTLKAVRRMIVEECVRVARKEGVDLEPSIEGEIARAASRYGNLSSMCQDVVRGRETEIGFLNGRVSELGREHGIPTPVNDTITALIRFTEGRSWT
jgi:2-dehydropantoate 2-reductase